MTDADPFDRPFGLLVDFAAMRPATPFWRPPLSAGRWPGRRPVDDGVLLFTGDVFGGRLWTTADRWGVWRTDDRRWRVPPAAVPADVVAARALGDPAVVACVTRCRWDHGHRVLEVLPIAAPDLPPILFAELPQTGFVDPAALRPAATAHPGECYES